MRLLLVPAVYFVVCAQSPDATDWQAAAGGKMAFEVASVKPAQQFRLPAFPLNAGNVKTRGGRFFASFPLWTYIAFAYKLSPTDAQRQTALAQVPKWVGTERFAIEARAEGNPTKDQMRLMMQSLLADRFRLAVHFEKREVPVFALTQVKPGKMGPKLRPHAEGPPCPADYAMPTQAVSPVAGGVFPANCGSASMWDRKGVRMIGDRDTTMALLADAIYSYGAMAGEIDNPVVDGTSLPGTFDFTIEYMPGEGDRFARPGGPSPDAGPANPQGIPFLNAVREQLGLKLVSSKASIRMLVIDRVERPSAN